jgi:2-dehydropantoate 2-reductase
MTDLVVGGGAVGTLLAWGLAAGGRDVAIVRRRLEGPPRRAQVTVIDPDGNQASAQVTEVSTPDALEAAPEVIIFAVKAFDLADAAASCMKWPTTPALTVLNGVGAEEIIAEARPDGGLIAGSVTASVESTGEGTVARLNRGGVALAPTGGDVDELTEALLAALAKAGLRTRRVADPAAMKWSKLVANLVGNASSAILDMSPAEIYGDRAGFAIERRQILEALAVMRHLGLRPVALPGANVPLLAFGVRFPTAVARPIMRRIIGGARGGKDPSLRIHARSGSGPSEVHWLNGAVARAADRLGLPAPVNRRLTELVDEVLEHPERRDWFRGRFDRLVEAVEGADTAAATSSRA